MRFLSAILLIVLLCGCGPEVIFEEPLPTGKSDLNDFPKRYRGSYVSEDGAILVHIDKATLILEYNYDLIVHIDSLQNGMVLKGDTLFEPDAGEYFLVTRDSSYITCHVNSKDTSFAISEWNKLRKAKGYLFLNYGYDTASWHVESMKLQKGELTFGYVSSQEEIELLNEITEQPSDTVAVSYLPSRKQFRKFVASNGFGEDEKYIKIK